MNVLDLISVNAGLPKVIGVERGVDLLSAIDKRPVTSDVVMVRAAGLEGDGQADLENHGGLEMAVYAYPADNWAWWESEHGLICRPGLFGENLTVSGTDEDGVRIGDRFSWGDAILEVSQPRAPCLKLAIHTGRPDAPQLMTLAARCGWYLRVLREGLAPARGAMERVYQSSSPTVRECFAAMFTASLDPNLLRRIHDAPSLSPEWQRRAAKKLRGLGG